MYFQSSDAKWHSFHCQNLINSILKSRDITLSTKVHLVKAMVFPVVKYGESWTIKKAEHWRIDAFELWCWRRLLRVPWTARRSNQSIPKEVSPGCSLEGLMLKLKLQYFGHLMWRADYWKRLWCWEGLWAGEEGDDRGWDGWMASPTRWTWVWVDSGSWWWTGRPGVLRFMGSQRVGHDRATELNWTELNKLSSRLTLILPSTIFPECKYLWLLTMNNFNNTSWKDSNYTVQFQPSVFHDALCIEVK